MKNLEIKDNGLLKSYGVFISENAKNKNIYEITKNSEKFMAKYIITKELENGICAIGVILKDGSQIDNIKYLPKAEALELVK